jgi:hypothetical protein
MDSFDSKKSNLILEREKDTEYVNVIINPW